MSLRLNIEKLNRAFMEKMPAEAARTMAEATALLKQSGVEQHALRKGARAPDFELPELGGSSRSLSDELRNGPVVLSFYRGSWCPYCNLEAQALQAALPKIKGAGARLLAIAPELPEKAAVIRDKGHLTFPLLYDHENAVARLYGLVFTLPEPLRQIYRRFGIDLVASQGNDRYELPIPAIYIVGRDRVIAYAFVDVDYTRRMEPDEIVQRLKAL